MYFQYDINHELTSFSEQNITWQYFVLPYIDFTFFLLYWGEALSILELFKQGVVNSYPSKLKVKKFLNFYQVLNATPKTNF